MLRESIGIWFRLGDRHMIARNLLRFARGLAVIGPVEVAVRLVAKSEALHDEIGVREQWRPRQVGKVLDAARVEMDEAAVAEASAQGRALSVEEAIALATSLGERA